MKTDPNNPAFAKATENRNLTGLTKREYFASQAFQGILARPNTTNEELAADEAVAAADALIVALNSSGRCERVSSSRASTVSLSGV